MGGSFQQSAKLSVTLTLTFHSLLTTGKRSIFLTLAAKSQLKETVVREFLVSVFFHQTVPLGPIRQQEKRFC
jgi:hypothetical protein